LQLILLAISLFGAFAADQFCATIDAEQAGGASGYVALQIGNGAGEYMFELDLSEFDTECDLNYGLTYAIHSFWLSENTSSWSCAQTGGHYDPNFACSTSSQSILAGCVDLGRIPPTYNYSCSSTLYRSEKYSYCEVGDTSGKAGLVFPSSENKFQLSTPFIDSQPPYAINFNFSDTNSLQWNSFTFDCAQTGVSLVCGQFSNTDLEECDSAFSTFTVTSSSDDDVSQKDYDVAVIISTILCFVGGLLIGFALRHYCYRHEKKETLLGN